MNSIAGRLAIKYPATDAGLGVRVVPLSEQVAGPQVRRALWVLLGAVLCVLLVACTNIANLLLARGASRSREFAIRAAMGAGRARLIRQLLTESVVMSGTGGLLGLIVTAIGLRALLSLAPADLPRLDEVRINIAVLAFAFLLSVATGVFFGLFPAWQAARRDPQEALKAGSRGGTASGGMRLPLIAAQYAFAVVLLTGAGLLLRSFLELQAVTPGFDPHRLLTFTVDLPAEMHGAKAHAFFEQAIAAIDRLPGVQSAAVGGTFHDHIPNALITVEGRASDEAQPFTGWGVSPEYFRTMGIPLRRGRLFSTRDTSGAVISESMARRFWPGQDPLGKRFKRSLPGLDEGNWDTVLGVVGDRLANGPGSSMLPTMYELALGSSTTTMVVRTMGDPLVLAAAVRRVVRAIDPATVPYFEIVTVEQQLAEMQAPLRFETTLLTIFAALATLLAASGIYGLLHHAVAQRTKEIGIRLALGAGNADIARLVLSHGLQGVGIGLLVGVTVSYGATRVLTSVLYGITPTDPATFVGVIVLLIGVAVAASSLPARRAVKVEPMVSLRHE
jgi:putative ABC transport system permease protein